MPKSRLRNFSYWKHHKPGQILDFLGVYGRKNDAYQESEIKLSFYDGKPCFKLPYTFNPYSFFSNGFMRQFNINHDEIKLSHKAVRKKGIRVKSVR